MSKRLSLIAAGAALATIGANDAAQAITFGGAKMSSLIDYNGVAHLSVNYDGGKASCTGTLLPSGKHILTAAHCFTDRNGNLDVLNTSIDFGGSQVYSFTIQTGQVASDGYYIYPGWDGFSGGDIAVLELEGTIPDYFRRYDIYRGSDEVGKIFTTVGYGKYGTGVQGANLTNDATYFHNKARLYGKNRFGVALENFGPINGSQLLFDFDDGTPSTDTLGQIFGINDPVLTSDEATIRLGEQNPNASKADQNVLNLLLAMNTNRYDYREVMIAFGDSGGPALIDGKIAGVSSYILSPGSPFDIDDQLNSSYGELAGMTRVSRYAKFVDDAMAGRIAPTQRGQTTSRSTTSGNAALISYNYTAADFANDADTSETESVPEPTSALGLLAVGLGGAGLLSRKRKGSSGSQKSV
jgi:secreted trypsin-like serine protease